MRNKALYLFLSFSLVGVLALAAGAALNASNARAQSSDPTPGPNEPVRTISVNGTGKVSLDPDIATISIGVHTENSDATEAVASNNAEASAVMSALLRFGIDEKDIQTSSFSIYPRQDYSPEGRIQGITFVVDNSVFVKVRDLDGIGEVLEAAVQAGANSISGISFSVEDPKLAYEAALEAAVLDARSRADVLARAAGVQLGAVQSISSYVSGGPVPFYREFSADLAQAAGGEVPISPGQTEISVEVSVVYAIR